MSSYIESNKLSEDPESIFGPDKKINLTFVTNSPDKRIQQKPFLITSNLQNSAQSMHWSNISFI